MKKPPVLDISIEHAGWRRIPCLKSRLEAAAVATLDHLPKHLRFSCTINLFLAGDGVVRKLNRDFRGVSSATNVLSFPQFDPAELPGKGKASGVVPVGDVLMGYQYIVVEAKKEHKVLINHVIHLLIHGILHLFGYDHGSDSEAAGMEGLEQKIMVGLNLPDPYARQTPATSTAVKKLTGRVARRPRA